MRSPLRLLLLAACGAVLGVAACPRACAAGKYTLAFWREVGAYENQAPPAGEFGNHSAFVHVWKEDGSPKAGAQLYTSWGVYLGATDANGFIEIVLYRPNGYDIQVRDGAHLSDTTPIFNVERAPNWGHYSWEVGFLFKTNATNPGTFDTSYTGTLNASGSNPCQHLSAPGTRSLAYRSTNPTNYCSDQYALGSFVASHGQTFVATGNRVIAVKAQPTAGFGVHIMWSAQILDGGPNGVAVSPVRTTRDMVSDEYYPILVKWGVNEAQVVPGRTYYLKIWRADTASGINVWHVNNNYPGGQYFSASTAVPNEDLVGLVVCGTFLPPGALGTISGFVRDTGGNPLGGATITINSEGLNTTSASDGSYVFSNVSTGAYSLTASKPLYVAQTLSGVVVASNQTTTANFSLPGQPLRNAGFESGFNNGVGSNWVTFVLANTPQFLEESGWRHGGTRAQRWWTSYATHDAGIYQQVAAAPGQAYTFSAWTWRSDQWNNGSVNEQSWVGIDPTGGVNALSSNVVWSAGAISYRTWTPQSVTTTARSNTLTVFVRGKAYFAGDAMITIVDDAALTSGVSTNPPTIPVTLVATGSVWRYLDDGSNPGANWRSQTFDDGAWREGQGELGYGDAADGRPEATLVGFGPVATNKFITTYFRYSWDLTQPSLYTNLTVRLVRDDGAVVYLNGAELFRHNMPGGTVTPATLATNAVAGADEAMYFEGAANPALLVSGRNTLAVEIHQSSATSSDISFDLELAGLASTLPRPTLAANRAGANVTLTWPASPTGFQLESAPSLPAPGWSAVTNPVTTSNNLNRVTLSPAGPQQFFRLRKPAE